MKIGVRIPSLRKRIAARTSVKRMVRTKVRVPRGFGWLTNPKKAAYNRIYHRTTVGCLTLPVVLLVALFVAVLSVSANHAIRPLEQPEWTPVSVVYLPVILADTTTTAAMPGANIRCQTTGTVEICASTSHAQPAQNTDVTIYGRLLTNGVAQQGLTMNTTWHYKSSTPTCTTGVTDSNGVALCTRSIGSATKGYYVSVDVSISGYSVSTWFTPQ